LPAVADHGTATALPEVKHRIEPDAALAILDQIKGALAAGDEHLALLSARAALRLTRGEHSLEVANLVSNASDVILPILFRALGGENRVISMRQRPSSKDNSMSPTHMFLASRIDGRTTIEELLDVSPLSNADTLGILLDFRDSGFLVVESIE
jgi:hypothetical protein